MKIHKDDENKTFREYKNVNFQNLDVMEIKSQNNDFTHIKLDSCLIKDFNPTPFTPGILSLTSPSNILYSKKL